jgi:hypothetical protein
MLDYGKSHVFKTDFGIGANVTKIFGSEKDISQSHCGNVNMFTLSTVQDILTITLSSLSIILKRDERFPAGMLIKLINFFSNTKFFSNREIKSVQELKSFVYDNSTFSNLIFSLKFELEQKTPMDFVNYLCTHFGFRFHSTQTNFFRQPASRFTFKVNTTFLDRVTDTAHVYYIFQKSVADHRKEMMEKLSSDEVSFQFPLESKFRTIYNSMISSVQLHSEIFWNKRKIKSASKNFKKVHKAAKSCLNYIEILYSILLYKGEYELLSRDRTTILKTFGSMLKYRRDLKRFIADCDTVFLYDSLIMP